MKWACLLLLLPSAVLAQAPPERPKLPFAGTEVFRYALDHLKLKPVAEGEAFEPSETVVVIFGDLSNAVDKIPGGLEAFAQAGGNFLVASDYRDAEHLRPWGLTIDDRKIVPPHDRVYRDPSCALIPPVDLAAHPIFLRVTRGLATNTPGRLQMRPHAPLLALAHSRDQPWQQVRLSFAVPYAAGSAADTEPAGRVLVLAGHGLFTNGMMLQPDNDNFTFAVNAIDWLREASEDRKRTRALFVVDGEVMTAFDANLKPPLPPIPTPPVEVINRLIAGMEEEDIFNRLILDQFGTSRPVAILLLIATASMLLAGAKKLLTGRHRHDAEVPRLAGTSSPVAASALQERLRALAATGNLGEAAHALCRDWRARHPGTPVVTGRWWPHFTLRRQLQRILALAEAPQSVSRRQFLRLPDALATLDRATALGLLVFTEN